MKNAFTANFSAAFAVDAKCAAGGQKMYRGVLKDKNDPVLQNFA